MDKPVTLEFIFETIIVILVVWGIGIILVNKRVKK